ncbi:MAG: glycerophosphodiester phosphodiesterase [Solirubrobacterales bacterium]|nr:glycerophosphodiester phosphodiesterase [Solirubrobacterales bacterium]MCB8970886.1 glycerophosphodiester phosphodiesterase [Thermoleophilales bacterium]MCO5326218.1 glycerophosphodiester phosphodiesterase [Solirubrobacterales bacterium]
MPAPAGEERRFRRVGHKGADALVHGNTVASFERAVEIGVDTIEFDVLWLADGRPEAPEAERSPLVVAHDWEDAASRPHLTLADALDAFTRPPLDRVEIDLDIKLRGREPEITAALRERDLIERAMVSTMYTETLSAIRALEPDLRLGWTYPLVTRPYDRKPLLKPFVAAALARMRARFPQEARRRAPEIGAGAIWLFHRLASPEIVAVTRELGIELICWTVDEPVRIAELQRMGVDGIVSNDPRLLLTPGRTSNVPE